MKRTKYQQMNRARKKVFPDLLPARRLHDGASRLCTTGQPGLTVISQTSASMCHSHNDRPKLRSLTQEFVGAGQSRIMLLSTGAAARCRNTRCGRQGCDLSAIKI